VYARMLRGCVRRVSGVHRRASARGGGGRVPREAWCLTPAPIAGGVCRGAERWHISLGSRFSRHLQRDFGERSARQSRSLPLVCRVCGWLGA